MPEPLIAIFDPTSSNLSKGELTRQDERLYNEYAATNFQIFYDRLFEITIEKSNAPSWMVYRT